MPGSLIFRLKVIQKNNDTGKINLEDEENALSIVKLKLKNELKEEEKVNIFLQCWIDHGSI